MSLIDALVKPEAIGDLLVRRITQHGFAATNHHRHFRYANVKVLKELSTAFVAIDVDVSVRMSISGQELADARGSSRMTRTNHNRVTDSFRDQFLSPKEEGQH